MRFLKISLLLVIVFGLESCASGYRNIQPTGLRYGFKSMSDDVVLEYKYDLLNKKYAKKEIKKGVKLIAIKIVNNSEQDLVFGKDIHLAYENGTPIYQLTDQQTFKLLKQSPASHLLYLLLTPVNLYTTQTNSNGFGQETNSIPIGLVMGPGLAAGNMITAGSANKKFKTDLMENNLNNRTIISGQTAYGLIGIKSNSYDALRLVFENSQIQESSEPVAPGK